MNKRDSLLSTSIRISGYEVNFCENTQVYSQQEAAAISIVFFVENIEEKKTCTLVIWFPIDMHIFLSSGLLIL